MSAAVEKKQEADFTSDVDQLLPQAQAQAKSGDVQGALEKLGALEKKTRNAADLTSTTRLLLYSLLLIRSNPSTSKTNWDLLDETIISLSKKHGQLKQAITKMVQLAMCFLSPPLTQAQLAEEKAKAQASKSEQDAEMTDAKPVEAKKDAKGAADAGKAGAAADGKPKKKKLGEDLQEEINREGKVSEGVAVLMDEAKTTGNVGLGEEQRLKLIETLRTVTEGKIFVEVERARVTRMLSDILYAKGEVNKAADILQELAIETFGSMDRREKTEFILEQMRLNLKRSDFTRLVIVSRKINTKFFSDEKQHDLKLTFYDLMIRYALHERKHLDVCKYYREILDTPSIKADEAKTVEVLRNVIIFLVLSKFDNEQSDLMGRVESGEDLDKVPEHKNLLKCFTTPELMRWPGIEALYAPLLRSTPTFDKSEDGNYRWEELHKRVVEHNIRVVSKYYTRIRLARLAELLDLSPSEAETSLADLVSSATIYAKIDRPAGVVSFEKRRDTTEHLNSWSQDMSTLLGLVEATSHLISRERSVAAIQVAGK